MKMLVHGFRSHLLHMLRIASHGRGMLHSLVLVECINKWLLGHHDYCLKLEIFSKNMIFSKSMNDVLHVADYLAFLLPCL
jgi:hypothetical protein